uniref:Transmembrane protein n=2 Tax=Cucumis melo TaxID=3656 RepID=A0A9I9D517_CUCME
MERHIRRFLNKLSFASIAIATLILTFLFLQTPQTCIPPNSPSKPHLKFLKSSCDSIPRELVSIDKKNKRLWSSNDWKKKLSSFINFFQSIRDLGLSLIMFLIWRLLLIWLRRCFRLDLFLRWRELFVLMVFV